MVDQHGVKDRHEHKTLTSARRKIVGGGSISLEICRCKAMRSVVERNGATSASEWEVDPPEENDDGQLELPWDGLTANDNTSNCRRTRLHVEDLIE